MSFFCDLSNYDDVKTSAQELLSRVKASDETMMPPTNNGGLWPAANIDKFETWVAGGCQPSGVNNIPTRWDQEPISFSFPQKLGKAVRRYRAHPNEFRLASFLGENLLKLAHQSKLSSVERF